MKSRITPLLLLIVSISAVLFYTYQKAIPSVYLYEAKIEPYTHRIFSNVVVQAKHSYEIALSVYPDTIVDLPWKIGDRVSRRAGLIQLDTVDEEILLEQVQSSDSYLDGIQKIKFASEHTILQIQEDLKEMEFDFAQGKVPEIELLRLRRKLEETENMLARETKNLEDRLRRHELRQRSMSSRVESNYLRSPIEGIISEVYRRPGEFLSVGETALVVFSDKDLELIGEVYEEDLDLLTVGKPASVQLNAYGSRVFDGEVDMIYPKNDQEMQKIKVRIALKNPPSFLVPGLKGLAAFQVAFSDFEVVVPATAVFRNQVQVVENGKVRYHPIEIGFRGLFQVLIRSGLPEGTMIADEFDSRIKDGSRVRIREGEDPIKGSRRTMDWTPLQGDLQQDQGSGHLVNPTP
jgi:RND family efflux transporter MFP subunit